MMHLCIIQCTYWTPLDKYSSKCEEIAYSRRQLAGVIHIYTSTIWLVLTIFGTECKYELLKKFFLARITCDSDKHFQKNAWCHGGDLGDWGKRCPNIWGWGRPMHPSPNILRSSVIGCVEMYELIESKCNGGIFCYEMVVSCQEKGHFLYIGFLTVETGKWQTKYVRWLKKVIRNFLR